MIIQNLQVTVMKETTGNSSSLVYGTIGHKRKFCRQKKKRVKLFLCSVNKALRHEAVWGSGGTASPFLTVSLDGGAWSASRSGRFTPGEKNSRYPLDRRQGRHQNRSGHCGREQNLSPLPEIELRSPAPIPSLYRLSYRGP
jgi:hypothetical protein